MTTIDHDPNRAGTADHPLNLVVEPIPDAAETLLTAVISPRYAAWATDHRVAGAMVVPGTTFVELALRAGDAVGLPRLAELTFHAPLVLSETDDVRIQAMVRPLPGDDAHRRVTIYSRPTGAATDQPVTRHAEGVLAAAAGAGGHAVHTAWPPAGAEAVDVSLMYSTIADLGYQYGPAFRGVTAAWRRDGEIFAEVTLPEQTHPQARRFGMHPALLDAALHGILLNRIDTAAGPAMPFTMSGVELFGPGATTVRARLTPVDSDTLRAVITDTSGRPVANVESFTLRELPDSALSASGTGGVDSVGTDASPASPVEYEPGLLRRLSASPATERAELLLDLVRSHAATIVGRAAAADILPGRAFRDEGFTSLNAVELRNRLNTVTGLRLPSTVVFQHPSPAQLAERLDRELACESVGQGSGSGILTDLDRLHDNLSRLDASELDRAAIAKRLRGMLGVVADSDGDSESEALGTASDEEMFALIDRELDQ